MRARSSAGRRGAASALALCLLAASASAAPLSTPAPKKDRARVVAAAEAFKGSPYRYGGLDPSGMDCSGLVVLSLRSALGPAAASAPRTAAGLYAWVDPADRGRLQPGDLVFFDTEGGASRGRASHVGVYSGDGMFVHAASAGARTGVIESSLDEPYWRDAFLGGGRALPPAEFLGLLLEASLSFRADPLTGTGIARGAGASFGAYKRFWFLEAGAELRAEWDGALGVARAPLVAAAGIDLGAAGRLRAFAGPALVLGDPALGGDRAYAAEPSWAAEAGISWSGRPARIAGARIGPYAELCRQAYLPAAGQSANAFADFGAGTRLACGLRLTFEL